MNIEWIALLIAVLVAGAPSLVLLGMLRADVAALQRHYHRLSGDLLGMRNEFHEIQLEMIRFTNLNGTHHGKE